ncbi:MobP2 family relaxase [Clostridium paraputrificum]|uniref:MobP2 family relaxase n=1 Tax=Clostridium paraputrificum TaxID=29363 RepID=UPI000668C0C9|nr:MobP2 family relaxase [Clostridium paraputrificum]MDB2106637.1 relaxase MobL [Clostridium paraputrificum]MDB2113350.1 relaxase MobL [Clostridium paraputrificum]
MSRAVPAIVMVCEFEKNNFKDYGGYIDYIDREETHNELDLKSSNYAEYLEYMDSKNRKKEKDKTTVKLFTEDKDILSDEDKEKLKNVYRIAQERGSYLWKDVFSFDNKWLEENKYYNSETKQLNEGKIREAIREAMSIRIEKENLNEAVWTADIHYNTDNIHIHTSLVELEPSKKKGKLKPQTLGKMKSAFVNSLVDRNKEHDKINELMREKIVNRKKDINTFKDKEMKKQFINIIKLLPEDLSQWQYAYNSIDEARPLIDNLSKYYINNYCKEDFNELDKLLDVEVDEYKKLYGEGREGKEKGKYKDYKTNELDYLYKRMGNAFLKEMKEYAKEQRKYSRLIERGDMKKNNVSSNRINITRKQINDVKRRMINELQHMKNKKTYRELEREIEAEKESLEY